MKALVLAAIASLLFAVPVSARTEATCWWDGLTLYATGLPTRDTFSLTTTPYPTGTTQTTPDGTFSLTVLAPFTAYFWQRGGGPSLWKPGPGLNDYHLIATCSA